MDIIEWDQETMLERGVRLGLLPESALPEGLRAITEKTRREKRGEL